jgi:hypothetical protein
MTFSETFDYTSPNTLINSNAGSPYGAQYTIVSSGCSISGQTSGVGNILRGKCFTQQGNLGFIPVTIRFSSDSDTFTYDNGSPQTYSISTISNFGDLKFGVVVNNITLYLYEPPDKLSRIKSGVSTFADLFIQGECPALPGTKTITPINLSPKCFTFTTMKYTFTSATQGSFTNGSSTVPFDYITIETNKIRIKLQNEEIGREFDVSTSLPQTIATQLGGTLGYTQFTETVCSTSGQTINMIGKFFDRGCGRVTFNIDNINYTGCRFVYDWDNSYTIKPSVNGLYTIEIYPGAARDTNPERWTYDSIRKTITATLVATDGVGTVYTVFDPPPAGSPGTTITPPPTGSPGTTLTPPPPFSINLTGQCFSSGNLSIIFTSDRNVTLKRPFIADTLTTYRTITGTTDEIFIEATASRFRYNGSSLINIGVTEAPYLPCPV